MGTLLTLRIAVDNYPYVQPLKDDSVKFERVRLEFFEVDPLWIWTLS